MAVSMEVFHTGEEAPQGTALNVSTMFVGLLDQGVTGMLIAIDLAYLAHEMPPGQKARRADIERALPGTMGRTLMEEGLANYDCEVHDITLAALRALAGNADPNGFDLTDPYTGNVVRPYRI